MTTIYSFLQKRKLHESQHGFIMVFIAYAISAVMLILGSDVFYHINTSAAGVSVEAKEETQTLTEDYGLQAKDYAKQNMNTELINPYGITEGDGQVPEDTTLSTSGDTIWMFGDSMDGATFDSIMTQLGSTMKENEKEVAAKEDSSNATTSSLSVKSTADTSDGVTEEELEMLQRIVQSEAGGEDMVGKILIVNVIMNRVESKHFPDTIKGVIFQKSDGDYQFSPVGSGRYWSVKISKDTKKAVKRALDGEDYSEGALYFVARKKANSNNVKWFDKSLDRLFAHGGHEFYKNK